tara:strand:- start:949 stop:1239 length:291 start_codon:yes stop_codon:yes gene_type:complete
MRANCPKQEKFLLSITNNNNKLKSFKMEKEMVIVWFDKLEKSYEITKKEWNEISHLCDNYSVHSNDNAHKHWSWRGASQMNELIKDNIEYKHLKTK